MTDLVTLIKTAIENVPQRERTGRLDTKAMAEAAAKVAVEEVVKIAIAEANNRKQEIDDDGEGYEGELSARRIAIAVRSLLKQTVLS